jgi:hypothetical protein
MLFHHLPDEAFAQLIAYYFMWNPGRPAAEQCEGCTFYTTQVGELALIQRPSPNLSNVRDILGVWRVGFCGDVTGSDETRLHDTGIHPAQPQRPAAAGVDKAHCLRPEPFDEFRAAEMRGLADLQHGLADREQAAHWEIVNAEIEVDVKLVTGQRHPVHPARDKLGHPGVHHGHLPLRVS